jgi:hypothetical protein
MIVRLPRHAVKGYLAENGIQETFFTITEPTPEDLSKSKTLRGLALMKLQQDECPVPYFFYDTLGG